MGTSIKDLLSIFRSDSSVCSVSEPPAEKTPATEQESEPAVCEAAGPNLSDLLKTPLEAGRGLLRSVQLFSSPSEAVGAEEPTPLQSQTTCDSPRVYVSASSLSFSNVPLHNSSSRSFTITNPTNCPINLFVSGPGAPFSSSGGGSIGPNSSITISVSFTPHGPGPYSGYIGLSPTGGSVSLSGTVNVPPEQK